MDLAQGLAQAAGNLTQPAVLFFVLGAGAALAGSPLRLPKGAMSFLSMYLMLCIGFKGGAEARAHRLDPTFVSAAVAGLGLALLLPVLAYGAMRKVGLTSLNSAAVAAHYGSVSVVTFAAAQSYLGSIGHHPAGYMSAVLALMETPGVLVAVTLAKLMSPNEARSASTGKLLHEALLNPAAVVLLGSFAIGLIATAPNAAKLNVFVGPVFQGVLCLFLLELGVTAAERLRAWREVRPAVVAMGVVLPLMGAALALGLGWLVGLRNGELAALTTLAGSASYIAAPAAIRLTLPKADAGLCLTLSLGVTFPFNILLGIPLYAQLALALSR
ncbi:sodium-dependent bicarbonate transport family permease [uncultured Caulobacter sp.]|uniref:sodium-dependent bicarbonate transport family permease n=1 Tax=uncultured Caulobacter sp. TaxID=158749 RepID=UPI0026267F30|nr:sodium-dependent bicarbonate transport family permease [uncultured Caulobacter sp.]